jgi:hypothetical protein
MSLYQLTKEAREQATYTACTHYVVVIKERSKCGTFDEYDYDIFQSVDSEDKDVSIVRECRPDYAKHQEIHGLNDHLFQKGVRNFVKTR